MVDWIMLLELFICCKFFETFKQVFVSATKFAIEMLRILMCPYLSFPVKHFQTKVACSVIKPFFVGIKIVSSQLRSI